MPRKKKIEEPTVAIVEDNPDFVRDLSTNAIINTNNGAFEARLKQIEKSRVDELDAKQSEDIVQLKKDVEEIKKLLEKIASK